MSVAEAHRAWEAIVDLALSEDIGTGDITTLATVPAETRASGVMLARNSGVISGIDVARFVFGRVDGSIRFEALVRDGDPVEAGAELARVSGPARTVLTAERTALNLIQRLSGVATTTARYVAETSGSAARIVDTRKTTPGLRLLEKQAVAHAALAVVVVHRHVAVLAHRDAGDLRSVLEASGGITLGRIREIAATGIDLISVGALTHSAPALDISLDLDLDPDHDGSAP